MDPQEEFQFEWPKTFSGQVSLYLTTGMNFTFYHYIPFALGYFATSTLVRLVTGTDKSRRKPLKKGVVVDILRELLKSWTQNASALQYQMQSIAQQCPPDFLPMFIQQLLQTFEQTMRNNDDEILRKYNTTADMVKLSIEAYPNDPTIISAVNTIQTYAKNIFSPASATDVENYTCEDAIRIVGEVLEKSVTCMEDIYMKLSGGKYIPTSEIEQSFLNNLNAQYMKTYSIEREQVLKKHGVNQEIISALANKFQNDPKFVQMLANHYASKKSRFTAMGVTSTDDMSG